jgi:hypothetical protein
MHGPLLLSHKSSQAVAVLDRCTAGRRTFTGSLVDTTHHQLVGYNGRQCVAARHIARRASEQGGARAQQTDSFRMQTQVNTLADLANTWADSGWMDRAVGSISSKLATTRTKPTLVWHWCRVACTCMHTRSMLVRSIPNGMVAAG